jgi:hypothetical protein
VGIGSTPDRLAAGNQAPSPPAITWQGMSDDIYAGSTREYVLSVSSAVLGIQCGTLAYGLGYYLGTHGTIGFSAEAGEGLCFGWAMKGSPTVHGGHHGGYAELPANARGPPPFPYIDWRRRPWCRRREGPGATILRLLFGARHAMYVQQAIIMANIELEGRAETSGLDRRSDQHSVSCHSRGGRGRCPGCLPL